MSKPESSFGADTNQVSFVYSDGKVEEFPLMDKLAVAHAVLDRAIKAMNT